MLNLAPKVGGLQAVLDTEGVEHLLPAVKIKFRAE